MKQLRMAYQCNYRSPFGDTTLTKVFVGGLAWETQTHQMRTYFQQFGHILEAVIITDNITGKSKGYGFVTYRDPEAAKQACHDPNPIIDGRRANCNIASLGRPPPSSHQGRNQGGNIAYQGTGTNTMGQGASSSYSGVAQPPQAPPPPPAPPSSVVYPPYGYPTYSLDNYAYQQAMYNLALQQPYYHQAYGTTSQTVSTPYYYAPTHRGTFGAPQAQRIQGLSYLYYPTQQMNMTTFPGYLTPHPPPLMLPTTHPFPSPSPTDSQIPQNTSEPEGGAVTSNT